MASGRFDLQAAGESNGGPQGPASAMQTARSAYPFGGSARGLCPPRVQSSAVGACKASAVFCQRQNTRRKWGIETPSPLTAFFGTFFVRTKKVHIPPPGKGDPSVSLAADSSLCAREALGVRKGGNYLRREWEKYIMFSRRAQAGGENAAALARMAQGRRIHYSFFSRQTRRTPGMSLKTQETTPASR